jgi:hypothetical protein
MMGLSSSESQICDALAEAFRGAGEIRSDLSLAPLVISSKKQRWRAVRTANRTPPKRLPGDELPTPVYERARGFT